MKCEEAMTGFRVKFAQISDMHLMPPGGCRCKWMPGEPEDLLQQALLQVRDIPDLDFVVFTGDLVDSADCASYNRLDEIVRQLPVPYFFSVGNHDIDDRNGRVPPGKVGRSQFVDWCRSHFNLLASDTGFADFVTFPKPGLALICIDASLGPCPKPQGMIRPEQLAWLSEQLDELADDMVVVAIHQPPLASVLFRNHRIVPEQSRDLCQVLGQHRYVAAVLSGHLHTPKRYRKGNTAFLTTPPLVGPVSAFRTIELEAPLSSAPDRQWGTLKYHWHPVNLQGANPKLMWKAIARGRLVDRTGQIEIAVPNNWGDWQFARIPAIF